LQDDGKFFSTEGMPRKPAPHGWKADESLYVAGLGRRGLSGAAFDAKQIASDISAAYNKY
jgi:indole-3-pyruvate monooxygenase